jgi:hypothetical protein
MNFAQIQAEVLAIIKRPDLVSRVDAAIKAATLKMHHSDFFYKDLVEVPIQFTDVQFIQNFVPSEILSNYRKVKYIRIWQGGANGIPGPFLEHIQIENSTDGYNYIKENVFYMAGTKLQIRTAYGLQHVLFGSYVHPIVSPTESYSSWIAEEYPYAIVYEAVRTIFRSIGFSEQANEFAQLAGEVLSEIKLSSIDDMPVT